MARIMCVEDSQEFQAYLSSVLKEHRITYACSVKEALELTANHSTSFDLILMDISLPDGNGMKALPKLKENMGDRAIPIIVISSDNDILTKVAAFGIGADDYVSKPPNSSELVARVNARLRWHAAHATANSRIILGDIHIDIENVTATRVSGSHSEFLKLTPYEFKILKLLAARPGQVFSRDHIIERLWSSNKEITNRTIDAHVSHLRRKIVKSDVMIETVLGTGYKATVRGNP